MKTVSVAQAATAQETVLPARVQEALGEFVGAAKEGLLALSVGVGLGVLAELLLSVEAATSSEESVACGVASGATTVGSHPNSGRCEASPASVMLPIPPIGGK